jgi:hypothetical protein
VPDFGALVPGSTGRAPAPHQVLLTRTNEAFGASFKGLFSAPADGAYTFYLKSDSGAQMWVHEAHVIDDDFNHDGTEVSATIRLEAGLHPVRIFYRHRLGPMTLSLEYSGPGILREAVVFK